MDRQTFRELAREIAAARPDPDPTLEQFHMTDESMVAQVADLTPFFESGHVLFIGDDDHLSVLLAKANDKLRVIVLEYDERVILSIDRWRSKLSLSNLVVQQYDVRDPVPPGFEKADAFCINPPYSSKTEAFGIKVWLSRALDACIPDCKGVLFMPTGHPRLPWVAHNNLLVQDFLGANGMVVTSIQPDKQHYVHTNDAGLASSSFYVARVDTSRRADLDVQSVSAEAIYR